MRQRLILIALAASLLPAWSALAQETVRPPDTKHEVEQIVPGDKTSQRIERIQINEPGAKIDELRVGGQTQNIRVKPAGGLPAYNVAPPNSQPRDVQAPDQRPGSTGPRTWKLLDF